MYFSFPWGKYERREAVNLLQNYEPLLEGDKAIITKQLGRTPRGVMGVAVRCPEGSPRVIVTYPVILHGVYPEVFPTLYWLTCPRLVKEISRLEGAGVIEEIQQEINQDPNLIQELEEVYQEYANRRMELVKESTLKPIRERYPAQYEVLTKSGVGGIMDKGIKCLHTHFADYLVNGKNPVGRLAAEQLGERLNELCHVCIHESE